MWCYRVLSTVLLALVLALLAAIAEGCSSGGGDRHRPIVLLTDFGADDYRVPSLKGAILKADPEARIVDGTHGVPAFDVATGAYLLQVVSRSFPTNSVFIGVIAPGSPKRHLAVTTRKDQVFLVPDNGLLTYVARDAGIKSIRDVTNETLLGGSLGNLPVNQVLGTAGALVASGTDPRDLGAEVTDPAYLDVPEARVEGGKLAGAIVYIDRFGNSVTNIEADMVKQSGLASGQRVEIQTPGGKVSGIFGTGYGDVPQGQVVVFVDSLGVLELAINLRSFAAANGVKAGTPVTVRAEQ